MRRWNLEDKSVRNRDTEAVPGELSVKIDSLLAQDLEALGETVENMAFHNGHDGTMATLGTTNTLAY